MSNQSEQLEKLKELLKISSESLTKKDFTDNFQVVIDLIKKLKLANKEEMDDLQTRYSQIVDNIKDGSEKVLDKTKEEAMDFCDKEIKRILKSNDLGLIKQEAMDYCDTEIGRLNRLVQQKLDAVKNGRDGRDANETSIIATASKQAQEALKPLIPTFFRIKEFIGQLGASIRDALEGLADGKKLKIEAIQDLREELDKLKREVNQKANVGFGGGGVGKQNVYYYDLSSQLNGVLKTFSLPAFARILDIKLSSAPVLRPTVDWTSDASAFTITFTSAIDANPLLLANQSLMVLYAI